MTTTVSDLRLATDRLRKALEEYESFLSDWQDASEPLSNDDQAISAEPDTTMQEVTRESGVAITDDVLERYHAASDALARYVQRARDQTHSAWSEVIAATESVQKATLAVHAAGFGTHPETGERDYLLPAELCPARRVSMNAGSSPVTFADRVTQYRAVTNQFGIDADVVYHPGSGHDVSPSVAFPEGEVTYVDVDVAAMDRMELVGVVPDDWPGDTPRIETTDLHPFHIEREGKMSPQADPTNWTGSPLDLYVFRESTSQGHTGAPNKESP